jgi:hypothetical protein
MTPNPQAEILSYFQNLLESNKLKFLKNKALNKIQEQYGSLVKSLDVEKGIIKYEKVFYDQATDGPVEAIVTYSFAQEFPKEVFKEAQIVKEKIDAIVFDINKAGNSAKEFLNTQAKLISNLIEKSKMVYPKLKFIETYLLEILTYLVDKYSLSDSFKKQAQINISQSSFFGIKRVKMALLIQLYDAALDLEVFDDEVVSQENFINVLTGNPKNTKEVLNFKCNNYLALHFINCIQPLFNELTQSKIAKSESFFNKGRKVFTEKNLNTTNSRLKNYISPEKDRITNHIAKILKTYIST